MPTDSVIWEQVCALPPLCEFNIKRLLQAETLRLYGRWGDGKGHANDGNPPPALLPEWHCAITVSRLCGECHSFKGVLWPSGHGHTASDAAYEALKQFAFFRKELGI